MYYYLCFSFSFLSPALSLQLLLLFCASFFLFLYLSFVHLLVANERVLRCGGSVSALRNRPEVVRAPPRLSVFPLFFFGEFAITLSTVEVNCNQQLDLWNDNNTCRKVSWCNSCLRLIGDAGASEKAWVSIQDTAREPDELTAILFSLLLTSRSAFSS